MRPAYHYAPRANWLSDPNGLVHHQGEWHLFYQYNPQGEDWGHMSWGHAVSPDLAAWEELPVAIAEVEGEAVFSGSAVIDRGDTAGFGRDAMVAVYTGAAEGRQMQCLAASLDRGRSFARYSGNPVIDLGLADFRDPNVFWHAGSGQWIMVVVLSAENRALVYGSADLKAWRELCAIAGDGAPGAIWECPLLIELPVEGGGMRWLFKVDVLDGGPGSGAIYRTGWFDGYSFKPEGAWLVADWGRDFYAAIAWHEPRDAMGRPVWIGWMGNHAYQGKLPPQGWRGAMSQPRRIWLRRRGEALVLCQQTEPAAVAQVPTVDDGRAAVPMASHQRLTGEAFDLRLEDPDGRSITLHRQPGRLVVERRDTASPFLDATCEVLLSDGAAIDLWCDAGSVEVIADEGSACLTLQHRLAGDSVSRAVTMTQR